MVKDYAKLNSQSLKATVVPTKPLSNSNVRNTTPSKAQRESPKPFPILGAIITIILAVILVSAIFMAFKHRDSIIAVKEEVATWIGKFHHHSKDKNATNSQERLSLDQSLSDPTQSMAATSSQQTLNLPSNINLNSPPPAPTKKKPKPAPAQAPQPVFDFYTVLPSGSANNPAIADGSGASSQPTPPPATTPANAFPAAKFVVDVGYFQDQQSANQLRSQLILMGLNPVVKNTGTMTNPVYQAELGPFDNITQANQVRQQLQGGGVSNIVVRPQN